MSLAETYISGNPLMDDARFELLWWRTCLCAQKTPGV